MGKLPYRLELVQNRLINSIRKQVFSGNDVVCEICGWEGKKFFGIMATCPSCKSVCRTRLIPFSLQKFNVPLHSLSALHIAPNKQEYNFFKKRIQSNVYDRLDIRPFEYTNIVADITNSQIKSNTYDFIFCWHVLEHIENDEKAISEMFRILKPEGRALISVPIYPEGNTKTWEAPTGLTPEEYLKYCGHDDHKRCCGYDYYLKFEKAGFHTRELKCSEVDPSEIKKYGLSTQHVAWLFTKPDA